MYYPRITMPNRKARTRACSAWQKICVIGSLRNIWQILARCRLWENKNITPEKMDLIRNFERPLSELKHR